MRASRCIARRPPSKSAGERSPECEVGTTWQLTVWLVLVGTDLFERIPVDVVRGPEDVDPNEEPEPDA